MRLHNRAFVKMETGDAPRGAWVGCGIVALPNLVQVYGPVRVVCDLQSDDAARRAEAREYMAARARRQRLPSHLRYEPAHDPRLPPEWDDIA